MRNFTLFAMIMGALALGGCKDKGEDSTGGDDSEPVGGFDISGSAVNLLTSAAAAEGLCVNAADPTAAIAGGDLEIVATGTVAADGTYLVADVVTDSTLGLLMVVADCASEGTVMPTATGISSDDYSGLGEGDAITDRTIYSIDTSSAATLQAGLEAAGYTGTLTADGALVGFVFDSAGTPIEGATISGGGTVYYFTGTGFNTTGTVAAAKSMFVIPAAGVGNYSCTADGYSFDNLLVGSQPGIAVVIRFLAE